MTTPARSGGGAWARLFRMAAPRLTKANLFVTGLAIILGFAVATQVRANRGQPLESLREDELVRVLDDVTHNGQRLGTELRDLERTKESLEGGATNSTAAVKAAQQRADVLGILAGTVPATGPGIRVTITDPQHKVAAPLLLDAVQELRDAGAEAISINDVRVTVDTAFTDTDGGVLISGVTATAPYVVLAVGEAATMGSAMDIPGGVVESVHRAGGEARVAVLDTVTITATRTLPRTTWAKPVAPTPSPTSS